MSYKNSTKYIIKKEISNIKEQFSNQELLKYLIDGIMLSDGHIRKGKYKSLFIVTQIEKHIDWIYNIQTRLKLIGIDSKIYFVKNKKENEQPKIQLVSSSPLFVKERARWYKDKKIIPKDLKINSLMIADWLMGDGSTSIFKKKPKLVHLLFHTQCFDELELEELKNKLEKKYSLGFTIRKVRQNQCILSLSKSKNVYLMLKLLEPFIVESFKYKLKFPDITSISEMCKLRNHNRNLKTGRFITCPK